MGSAISASESVRDVRQVGGQDSKSTLSDYHSLPTISDLEIGDRIELIYHLRSTYQEKIQEITSRRTATDEVTSLPPSVRASDVDDLLYAQIELDTLIDDLRKMQTGGPLSVADVTKGVEHMFSRYDTDGA